MGKKIGVVLSGCGVYDGAEIHESVITLLAIDRLGAEAVICAPDRPQLHVVNHLSGEVEEGTERNVLVESARIARGAIRDVAEVTADELDALILPGGFGAAKNLCDFAVKGADCDVDGAEGPELTIGNDADTADAIEAMGAAHVACPVREFVIDHERKLISSPAYMLAGSISEAAEGIEKTVATLVEMA